MRVAAELGVEAPAAAVWAALADIGNAAAHIRGIERIEMLERPAHGLVGMRWRETRILFGDEASVEKRITAAVDGVSYETVAESDGFVFTTTVRLAVRRTGVAVTSVHDTRPQGLLAAVRALPMFLFKGVIRKAILQDLHDIKTLAERTAAHA